MKHVYFDLVRKAEVVKELVLATIITSRGSTPQKAGISAIFSKSGLEGGTIGGGALEGRIQSASMEAAGTGTRSIHRMNLNNDISMKEEAICGGIASVLVDAAVGQDLQIFKDAVSGAVNGISCVVVSDLTIKGGIITGLKRMLFTYSSCDDYKGPYADTIHREVRRLLTPGCMDNYSKWGDEEKDDTVLMFESVLPPLKLVIAGAGHIGRSLTHLASMLGFEVTVIDDRSEYANSENIPEADNIVVKDVGEALNDIRISADTYIVIVTRGHNDDAKALRASIGKGAAYLGMIGSRTKIEKMHRDFISNGWASEREWASVYAPVGIEIGSKTVEEIAISIAAQLVMVKNNKNLLT